VAIGVAVGGTAVAAFAAKTPPPPPGWKPGWLVSTTAYLGQYHLLSSTSLSGATNAGVQGQMTLFMQAAFGGKPPTPGGIISLHATHSTLVFYLTLLDHDGTRLESLVHGGAFVAPATGKFRLSELKNGTIVGTLTQKGLAAQTLTFKRFSKKTEA
jgi:hypothetical protein